MPIRLLSEEVASQISAGEVVERPASVVKELIENALDAKSTSIEIRVEGAGLRIIEVADNGHGISAAELPLAVMRHATSKLSSAQDLFNISTLGFRGEALASIASVSRMTVVSHPNEAEQAASLYVEGGKGSPTQAHAYPAGTMIRVEDLFFNVPARLKFLKKETTERRAIEFLCSQYALAFPQVRFRLHQEQHLSFQSSGNSSIREVLSLLYGSDIARQLLEVQFNEETIHIDGFISPFSLTRTHRNDILFFVNHRPVRDFTLSSALLKAYHTMLMVGRYPLGVLFLDIPAQDVDVNVHPTKAEVRFREREHIFSAIIRAARRTLISSSPIPQLYPSSPTAIDPAWQMAHSAESQHPSIQTFTQTTAGMLNIFPQSKLLRPIGQVANTYLIAEAPDGLYLIDQHAAHERILFEKMLNQKQEPISSQALLEPVVVDMPSRSGQLYDKEIELLNQIGFLIEPFGNHTYIIRAVPPLLERLAPQAALQAVIDELEEDETPLKDAFEARLIARICKRAAVKAGMCLTSEEQASLLFDLQACASPRSCPHGRPTMIHLSVDLLERQFGRKGAIS